MASLRSHLQEIYRAIKNSTQDPLPLVSNVSATCLYDVRSHRGRLWSRFYRFSEAVAGKNLRQEKLAQAFRRIHAIFQRKMAFAVEHLQSYQEYLERSGKGYAVEESRYFAARKAITQWNNSTAPFVKLLQSSKGYRLIEHFPVCSAANALYCCQKIIDLEGITQGPLPLAIFKKILRGKPLNATESKDLDKWVRKLNQAAPNVRKVHQGMEEISRQYGSSPAFMELALEDKGCKVFQKNDQKHLLWRQQLADGTKVAVNGRDVTIAARLSSSDDQTWIYALKEEENRVAVVANNRVVLPIRALRVGRKDPFGIKPVQFLEMAADGRLALMERLLPLNAVEWKSQEGEFSPEDAPLVEELAAIIRDSIERNQTPSDFSPGAIMFDKSYKLRVLKPSMQRPFDFNALEDFAWECASGNLTIFRQLMSRSGLASHPIAKFYRDLISNFLKNDEIAADDLAGIYKIADPRVVDRGMVLVDQVKSLQQQVRQAVPERHLKEINKALINCHQANKSAGRICPSFFQSIMTVLKHTRSPGVRMGASGGQRKNHR